MNHFCIELNKQDPNYEQMVNMLTFIAEQLNCIHIVTKPDYADNTRRFHFIHSSPNETFQFISQQQPINLSSLQ